MEETIQLELRFLETDNSIKEIINQNLKDVTQKKVKSARAIDAVSLLAISAGVITLANELISLYKSLKKEKKEKLASVSIKNFNGDELKFENCSEELIREFVNKSGF